MKSRLYGKLEMLDGLFSSIKNSRHADASEIKMKGTLWSVRAGFPGFLDFLESP